MYVTTIKRMWLISLLISIFSLLRYGKNSLFLGLSHESLLLEGSVVQRGLIVEDLVSWIFSANPILSNASVEISPVAWSLVPEPEQVQAASTFCVKCRCIQQNKCDPGFLLTFRSGLAYKKFTFSESARSHFQLQSLSGLKFGFYAVN